MDSLPDDMIYKIFLYALLPMSDLTEFITSLNGLSRTCSLWTQLLSSPRSLMFWSEAFQHRHKNASRSPDRIYVSGTRIGYGMDRVTTFYQLQNNGIAHGPEHERFIEISDHDIVYHVPRLDPSEPLIFEQCISIETPGITVTFAQIAK